MSAPAQPLYRHLVTEASDDDLPASRFLRAMHREQISLEDAGVTHRKAAHAQQIVSARREEIRVDLVMAGEIFFRQNWCPRRHAPDHRQLEQARGAAAAAAIAHADAARGARGDLDRALLLERAQVLLGGVDRAKAHPLGDFGARRRVARDLGQLAHEAQDFALPVGESVH